MLLLVLVIVSLLWLLTIDVQVVAVETVVVLKIAESTIPKVGVVHGFGGR